QLPTTNLQLPRHVPWELVVGNWELTLGRRTLADGYRHLERRAAAQEPQRGRLADPVAREQVEQILGCLDGLPIKREDDVANQHARLCGGTVRRHADDEQCLLAIVRAALRIREASGLAGDADVAALAPAML